ncbi:hypothetical protein L1887_58244 [Cichorium endivia]|nr:hypothetical protein L1887_58244 [Cichorium endivia]
MNVNGLAWRGGWTAMLPAALSIRAVLNSRSFDVKGRDPHSLRASKKKGHARAQRAQRVESKSATEQNRIQIGAAATDDPDQPGRRVDTSSDMAEDEAAESPVVLDFGVVRGWLAGCMARRLASVCSECIEHFVAHPPPFSVIPLSRAPLGWRDQDPHGSRQQQLARCEACCPDRVGDRRRRGWLGGVALSGRGYMKVTQWPL